MWDQGRISTYLAEFFNDARANVAVIFAIALLPTMIGVGAAIDYSRGSSAKASMQGALDAVALSLVKDAGSLTASQTTAKANEMFKAKFNRPEAFGVTVASLYDSTAQTLTLNASAAMPTNVTGVIGVKAMTFAAESKARAVSQQHGGCVIALDPKSKETFSASGNGTVSVPNCGIYVNSGSGTALKQQGAGSISAKSIHVVGGATKGSYSPMPLTGQPKIGDPLKDLPEPVPGACTHTGQKFNSPQYFKGGTVFCKATEFNADITFGPGVHYFVGASVKTASAIRIIGDKAMLYLDGNGNWDSTGTGDVQWNPPTSGIYKGIAVFGSRSASSHTVKLSGNKDYLVLGSIYLPKGRIELYGNIDLTVSPKSGFVIAWQFFYQGNSSFTFDAHGGPVPIAMEKTSHVVLVK